MADILKVDGLTKEYPGFKLDNISFTLPGGCIMGLIGENGAGKSTTIKAILGLIKPDGGSVSELDMEDVGVVYEDICVHQGLTPVQVGKIYAAAYKNWEGALYESYLRRFGLDMKKEIKAMSRGMRMKLSIALALSHRPKLLIMDEATGGLDPVMRDEMLDVFLDFVQDEEHSILMSSHITTDLEKIADYICFIHKGKLLLCKSKDELMYNYGIIRCGKANLDRISSFDALVMRKEDYQYSLLVADKAAVRKKYPGLVVDDAGLEDIMLMYVKGSEV